MSDVSKIEPDEGQRLVKRVMQLCGCSRSQAQAFVEAGAVRVNGAAVLAPGHRVAPDAQVVVDTDHAQRMAQPLKLLLHKPAGQTARQALLAAWPQLAGDWPLPALLRDTLAVPYAASGLSVWTSDAAWLRHASENARQLEQEWQVQVHSADAAAWLAGVRAPELKVSLGHTRGDAGFWRVAGPGWAVLQAQQRCVHDPVSGLGLGWHRLRAGRLALAKLGAGQLRWATEFEKF